MGELRHGFVVQEIRDDDIVQPRAAEQRIQVYGGIGFGQQRHQLVPGVRHLVYLRTRVLDRPLVLLDVNEVF